MKKTHFNEWKQQLIYAAKLSLVLSFGAFGFSFLSEKAISAGTLAGVVVVLFILLNVTSPVGK